MSHKTAIPIICFYALSYITPQTPTFSNNNNNKQECALLNAQGDNFYIELLCTLGFTVILWATDPWL